LVEDLREVDDEVAVDIYSESAPLTFTRSAAKVPIFEYSIVCDVNVTQGEKPKGRGAKPSVKINKQQFNKVTKHMETAGKSLVLP
jgi:hypothetical protein